MLLAWKTDKSLQYYPCYISRLFRKFTWSQHPRLKTYMSKVFTWKQ